MLSAISSLQPARTVVFTAALCVCGAGSAPAQEHVLHVAVADNDGNPVTGLTEDDIVVQWDGRNMETTGFEVVDWPVRLTVFVDNSNAAVNMVGQIREGLRRLLRELPAEMEIAMLTTARQVRWITRHTTDRAELEGNIPNIAPDTGAAPTYIDALVEETNRLDEGVVVRGRGAGVRHDVGDIAFELRPVRRVPGDPARLPGRGQHRDLHVGRQLLQERPQAFAELRHEGDGGIAVVDEDGEPDRPVERLELGRLEVLAVPLHDDVVLAEAGDRVPLGVGDGDVQGVLLGLRGQRGPDEAECRGEQGRGGRSKTSYRNRHGNLQFLAAG